MSQYKNTQDSFSLVSRWTCGKITDDTHPQGYWAIVSGPTEASRTVTFPLDLPAGAIVAKAWIGVTFTSSPNGGVRYQRINGEDLPSDGKFEITVTADATSVSAVFSFKSYGTVESDENEHRGTLGIGSPTLYVDYVDTAGGEIEGDDTAVAVGNTSGMRLPRLLDADLHEKTRLNCLSLRIELNLDPLSTAEMTLPPHAPGVDVDDFVELFTPYGSAGIFRVCQTDERLGYTRGCSLRHGIVTLADDLVTAGNAISAPVGQVFASLLAMQTTPLWVMGDCEIPDDMEIVLERNYQTLLTAFTDLTASLPDGYAWVPDQTVSPWKLHLRKMPEDDACEFRLNRSLKSLTVSVDRDEQCTRLYAFGAGEGEDRIGLTNLTGTPYLDADSVAENGKIIARAITNENIFDALTLKDVAQRYLDRHKNPKVSIQVDAIDVYRATGISFDKFHLGKICRVPLPRENRLIREKVVSIVWRDVIGDPANVSAYLADRLRDASDELAELMREATGSKLIGGTVETLESDNYLGDVTQTNSLAHFFDIAGYGNVLSVRAKYTPPGDCRLLVDGENEVPADETESGSVELLRYLKADANGVPVVGEHNVQYFARGSATIAVKSYVTLKTIEKR